MDGLSPSAFPSVTLSPAKVGEDTRRHTHAGTFTTLKDDRRHTGDASKVDLQNTAVGRESMNPIVQCDLPGSLVTEVPTL